MRSKDPVLLDPSALPKHPAKFSRNLYEWFEKILKYPQPRRLLDPFGGIGGIFTLTHKLFLTEIFCVEIEPEWAAYDSRITVGNALDLPYEDDYFDAACTSPTYGNRMADHHEARDSSKRNTYRHTLGRPLASKNSGQLQWGPRYREFHIQAWTELRRVLQPNARFVLNCKNHIRKGKIQRVTEWHVEVLNSLGFHQQEWISVLAGGNRQGQNGDLRVAHEDVILFNLSKKFEGM